MFGTAKNGSAGLTGLERAKLERGQEPQPIIDDLPSDAELEAVRTVVAKKGFSFPEKQKPAPQSDSSAHLYVGANIHLKGEITGCDMMRIEGTFEGTSQARQLVLCPSGTFIGIAEFDDAEIEGHFEGTLNVRGRLFLKNKGRIRGTFSYGQLEIERGGEVEGRIVPYESRKVEAKAAAAPAVQPRAPAPSPSVAAILAAAPPGAPRPVQPPVSQPIPAAQAVRPPAPPSVPKPATSLNGSGGHTPSPDQPVPAR